MKEVILKTAGMFDEYDPQYKDYELWKSISEYMDGEDVYKRQVLQSRPDSFLKL